MEPLNTMHSVTKVSVILSIATILLFGCYFKDSSEDFARLVKEADGLYEKSRHSQAVAKYQEALAIKANDEYILKRIGLSYLRMGEYGAADHFLMRYGLLNEEDLKIKAEIIRIRLLKKDLAAAQQMISELKDREKENTAIILLQGNLEMIKKNYEGAAEIFLGVLKKDKENISASISLAICKYAQGDKDSAEQIAQKIKYHKINQPALLLQLGDYYRLTENDSSAEKAYLEAVNKSKEELGYKLNLVNYYLDKSNYKNAIVYLNEILAADPSSKAARKLITQAFLSVSDLENAHSHLKVLEKSGINDTETNLLKGRFHLQCSEPALAETYFETAVRNDPESAVAHYWSAIALLNTGQIQLAKQHLINALSVSPGFVEAELVLCGIYYRMKEYDISKEYLTRIIEKDPNNIRAYKLLGGVQLAQNNLNAAVEAFKTAEKLNPIDSTTQYYLGRLHEYDAQQNHAMTVYKNIIEQEFVANAALRYAKLMVDANRHSEAVRYFSEMLERNPTNHILLFILAEISRSAGNYEQAIQNYQKFIKKEQTFVTGYVRLADLHLQRGELEKAKHVMSLCETKNRDSIIAYLKNASIHNSQNLKDETLELLTYAEKIFDDNDIIQNNIAYLYLEKDSNLNMALDLAQSAYQKNHNIPTIIDTLGWAYHKKGMHRQALWYLRRGLQELEKGGCKEKDHCAIVQYHLGSVLFSLQQHGEAKRYLQSALSLGLKGADADKANSLLNSIQSENETLDQVGDEKGIIG